MKMINYCLIAIALFVSTLTNAHEQQVFVGDISAAHLISDFEGFSSGYRQFEVNQSGLDSLRAIKAKVTIVALFGTWCHDSEREVPRMIKLLETVDNSNIELSLKAVDLDKKGADESFKFKYTPTFIVYHQGEEIGRIVERPALSLAEDLAQIIQSAGS